MFDWLRGIFGPLGVLRKNFLGGGGVKSTFKTFFSQLVGLSLAGQILQICKNAKFDEKQVPSIILGLVSIGLKEKNWFDQFYYDF